MAQNIISQINLQGTQHYIASSAYGICTTAANQSNKIVNLQNSNIQFTLTEGTTIHIKFTYSNTAYNPTLTVNGLNAAPIYRYGTTPPGNTVQTSWFAGSLLSLTYTNGAFIMNDFSIGDTGEGGDTPTGNIPQPGNQATLVQAASSSGSPLTTTYSRSDHVHGIEVVSGPSDGQITIANQSVTPFNLKAGAFKGVATTIPNNSTDNTNIPTLKAVADYVRTHAGSGGGGGGGTVLDSPAFYQIQAIDSTGIQTIGSVTAEDNRDIFKLKEGNHTFLTVNDDTITIGSTLTNLASQPQGTDLSLVTTGQMAIWDAAAAGSADVVTGGVKVQADLSEYDDNYHKLIIDNHATPQGEVLIHKLNMAILYLNGNLNFDIIQGGN